MLTAVGWALFASVQPLGIIAYIALLGSPGSRRNTRGFIVGWILCAVLVAVITVQFEGHSQGGGSSSVISSAGWLQVVLGVATLALLVVRRRRRRAARPKDEPAGEAQEGVVGPVGAALIAAMLQGWPVVAAAVAAVVKVTDPDAGRVLGIAVVVVVSTITYLVAYVLAGLYPERTAAWLARLKLWIETHRDTVIDLVLVAVGVWLVGHGLVVQLSR